MRVPKWLREETFRVEHSPASPAPYLVRLCAVGHITGTDRDAKGYGKTLAEAAVQARRARDDMKTKRLKLVAEGL